MDIGCGNIRDLSGLTVERGMRDSDIGGYNDVQLGEAATICRRLTLLIDRYLTGGEGKIWHRHPVWFLDGNPIVGYSVQKPGARLMFWSGVDFDEPGLSVLGKKFKDASIFYNQVGEIDEADLARWLTKAIDIQWDYQHIVKRKGVLMRRPSD